MTFLKLSVGTLIAVFFFALGIYFQGTIPASTPREPASLASAQSAGKLDQRTTNAFKGCLDSKVKNGSVNLSKVVVEGRRWSIVSIPCSGDTAKDLYDAIQPHSTEEYVRYRDKRRGVVRFFGRLFPPSQCVEMIGGKSKNDYSCSIRIDVDAEITEQLKL